MPPPDFVSVERWSTLEGNLVLNHGPTETSSDGGPVSTGRHLVVIIARPRQARIVA
jgi:hypothetical protein